MTAALPKQAPFTIENKHQTGDSFRMLDLMRREGKLCDVTLMVGNVEILAHRNVLASCSPYFYSIFINAEDVGELKIEMSGDPQLFLSIVNYMYTSKLTVQEDDIKNVLKIARTLLLHSIVDECLRRLKGTTVDTSNWLDRKSMAVGTYGDSELLNNTPRYIDDHFSDVVASEGFMKLTNDELVGLISRDTLKVPSEEKIYECVINWIDHDPKGRRKYLRPLMERVRFPFISKTYLKQQIAHDLYVRGDAYCKDLILNALLLDDLSSTSQTTPRHYLDKILLVMGGNDEKAKRSLEYFDFTTRNWSKVVEIPFGVEEGCSIVANRNVYVLGGFRKSQVVNSVHLYDLTRNSWHEINGMIMARRVFGVALLNSCIYAMGGLNNNAVVLSSVERFNLDTQQWTSVAPMLTNRHSLGVCVVNDMLYAIGGYDGGQYLKSVECYDYRTNSWKKLRSMNETRYAVGVCALDAKIYAIGGWDGVASSLQTAEVYDPKVDTWTQISPMSVPRWRAGVAIFNSQIYVVGGKDVGKNSNSVEIYDKQNDSWAKIPEAMNVARVGSAAVITNKNNQCTFCTLICKCK